MGSFGTIALKEVWRMLDYCAHGHTRQEKTHNWCIRFNGKTYPSFPLGEHGARKNPDVEVGHVRKMARSLGITECAKGRLPQLG